MKYLIITLLYMTANIYCSLEAARNALHLARINDDTTQKLIFAKQSFNPSTKKVRWTNSSDIPIMNILIRMQIDREFIVTTPQHVLGAIRGSGDDKAWYEILWSRSPIAFYFDLDLAVPKPTDAPSLSDDAKRVLKVIGIDLVSLKKQTLQRRA